MKAMVVTDQAAGTVGMTLAARPEPQAAGNNIVVQVHEMATSMAGNLSRLKLPSSRRQNDDMTSLQRLDHKNSRSSISQYRHHFAACFQRTARGHPVDGAVEPIVRCGRGGLLRLK